jgi:hypothetical protein
MKGDKAPVGVYLCIYVYIYKHTNTQEATTHSAAPSKYIHSDTQKILHGTSPKPRPTGLCKHSQTCTVHKTAPTHPYTKLAQKCLQQRMPDRPRQGQPLRRPPHVGGSSLAGLSAHNSPRRRAQRGSGLALLVHTLLASVDCVEQ